MAAVDRHAADSLDELVERAGAAVAHAAIEMLGTVYGRRVIVIAGSGNNGADGRVAAQILRTRGAAVEVREPSDRRKVKGFDLLIDAAFGTGFRGTWDAPVTDGVAVLAVDIASGVNALSGAACGTPLRATRTVTFAAMKPGLFFADGPSLCGEITLADIGLDLAPGDRVDRAPLHLLEADDLVALVPDRDRAAHKWNAAVLVVAGSPRMPGAAALAAMGAQRGGAGYVRVASPGIDGPVGFAGAQGGHATLPVECVRVDAAEADWSDDVLSECDRVRSIVLGPGLGRDQATGRAIRAVLRDASVPVVVDADALRAIGDIDSGFTELPENSVLTPHDGEFAAMADEPPGADRVADARDLAERTGAVVVLKGPTTVVAAPNGRAVLVNAGDERLATAGTGDVLSGVIAALLARGANAFDAASAGALAHGLAARRLPLVGTVAGDLPPVISEVLSEAVAEQRATGPRRTRR